MSELEQKSTNIMLVNCPTCQTPVPWQASSTFRPFCSERCKLIDLGEWASDNRRITDKSSTETAFTELELTALDDALLLQEQQFFQH